MSFTQSLWQSIEPIYYEILHHPYNVELGEGILAISRFEYYLQQDELYLQDYRRALSLLAAKSPDSATAEYLLNYALEGIAIERQLHQTFFQEFHLSSSAQRQPACFHYGNFLLACCSLQPFAVGLAAILPCFWVYHQVGSAILRKTGSANPYELWIETYNDPHYVQTVEKMIDLTEQSAAISTQSDQETMRTAFILSTQLELQFWEAAYRLEKWPFLQE